MRSGVGAADVGISVATVVCVFMEPVSLVSFVSGTAAPVGPRADVSPVRAGRVSKVNGTIHRKSQEESPYPGVLTSRLGCELSGLESTSPLA